MASVDEEKVVSELEAQALSQFDSLVKKGELFWNPSEEIEVEQSPFNVRLNQVSYACTHGH